MPHLEVWRLLERILKGVVLIKRGRLFGTRGLLDEIRYRSVSILSKISKTYERCLYYQIQIFFCSILSKYQSGFWWVYNGQHCLIILIDKWKKVVNNGGAFDASFTDLFNTFDSLSLDLLIAKLDAYGFDKNCLTK